MSKTRDSEIERRDDKIEGLEADLDYAIEVLIRRGDDEARRCEGK